jgi:hypothetical protein
VSVGTFCLPNLLLELHRKFVYIRDEKDLQNSVFFLDKRFSRSTKSNVSVFLIH